jgi:hypothetical protein
VRAPVRDGASLVEFRVYRCPGLALPVVAELLRELVPLPLARRTGSVRGEYYRWSGDDGPDLLVQTNVVDEDDLPLEPGAAAHEVLLYVTEPPGPVLAALAALDGLTLVATDVVEVPASPVLRSGLPGRPDASNGQRGTEGDAARDDREPLQVVR